MSDTITNLLTIAVLGYMGVRLVGGARHARSGWGRALTRRILANVGWRHVWPAPILLFVVASLAFALMSIPGLDWGWWSALGGDGNPVFGSSTSTTGTVWEWLVPVLFLVLLVPALPLFAHAEERMFRAGAEAWSARRRVFKVLQFGLAHALVGIPLGAALALSVGGAYFMWCYLRVWRTDDRSATIESATIESATAHTVYNAMIVAVVAVALVADAFV